MKTWLPEDALEPAALAPALAAIFEPWSDHWFSNGQASAAPLYQDDWPEPGPSLKWRSMASSASVALTGTAQCAIASAMLGHQIVPVSLQQNDHSIIDSLAAECVDDLLRRITQIVAPANASDRVRASPIELDDCRWWEVSLFPGKRAFKLAIAKPAQIELVRADLAPARKSALESLAKGLSKQNIKLVADLGRCSISLAELEELGAGDVLVLDQPSEEPFKILLDSNPSPFRGNLETVDGKTSLVLAAQKEIS